MTNENEPARLCQFCQAELASDDPPHKDLWVCVTYLGLMLRDVLTDEGAEKIADRVARKLKGWDVQS